MKEAEKGGVFDSTAGIEISLENMLERRKEIEAIIGNNYVESVMKIQLAEFIAPQDVANPAGSYLCMTTSQINPSYECGRWMKVKVANWC